MERVASFEKVSWTQFLQDFPYPSAQEVYAGLRLPRRATVGSAGYDFFAPVPVHLEPGEGIRLATGIRVRIDPGWVLLLFPRSSLGFRYRLQLDNTVGVIDSDYYGTANEGHIFVKLTNAGNKALSLSAGEAIFQGIFVPFGITQSDETAAERTGGLGSTSSPKTERGTGTK